MPGTGAGGVNRALTRLIAREGVEKRENATHIDPIQADKLHPEPVLSRQPEITVYTSAICAYCVAAKNFLKSKGLSWNEVRIDTDPDQREKMMALTRRSTVPQIFIGQTHVGGYDDMMALHRAGKLEPLLSEAAE